MPLVCTHESSLTLRTCTQFRTIVRFYHCITPLESERPHGATYGWLSPTRELCATHVILGLSFVLFHCADIGGVRFQTVYRFRCVLTKFPLLYFYHAHILCRAAHDCGQVLLGFRGATAVQFFSRLIVFFSFQFIHTVIS